MANVKVAVRVRPLDQREKDLESPCIVDMTGQKTTILDPKSRESKKEFSYDYSYWSAEASSPHFISQEKVYSDLGSDVLKCAKDGYNSCVFAYGQTGSGKTYTMMGTQDNRGLIPRICQGLFDYMEANAGLVSFKVEVSYMEIYNEKVRDLLRPSTSTTSSSSMHNLRVREHPKDGPYVENLTRHLVSDFSAIQDLMTLGNTHRVTASTLMNDVSSRSHAIFTIMFTQAKFEMDMPSETISRLNLVDLAGSERASATGATGDRLKEGGNINKSLVTLGNVISALAEISTKSKSRTFIPYRDSVLTWLLKDSLGGNAKTIMVATISPAAANYSESLSTLRYANRAKNILNKPTVNEDPNVKLIRELKAEIERLKAIISADKTLSQRLSGLTSENIHRREEQVAELTKTWAGKWKDMQRIIEEKELALHSEGVKMMVASELPHFIGVDDDLLSTGVVLYHLQPGITRIGSVTDNSTRQHIVLEAPDIETHHCRVENNDRVVTLHPEEGECYVDGDCLHEGRVLTQGSLVQFGSSVFLRFNHPQEALRLKEERKKSGTAEKSSIGPHTVSLLSAVYSPLKDAELKEEREKMDRERLEFERQKEELEEEFTRKVALIRQEVEEEKERLRVETEREMEQLKVQRSTKENVTTGPITPPSPTGPNTPTTTANSTTPSTPGESNASSITANSTSAELDTSSTPASLTDGLASPLTTSVHPEGNTDGVKEWSTSESSFPIQNFSKQAVAMEGVKPLHYRQVVGNESVEEGFTSPLPQTHMETQKTRQSGEKSVRKALFQSTSAEDNEDPLTKSQFVRVLSKKEKLLQRHVDTITQQQRDKAQLEERLKALETQVNMSPMSSPTSKSPHPSVKVSVPRYGQRRNGYSLYYVFEVSVVTAKEKWLVHRRYNQFETLHYELQERYPQLKTLILPPTKFFGVRTPEQLRERCHQLNQYIKSLIAICSNIPGCPIYAYCSEKTCLKTMKELNSFFVPNLVEAPVDFTRTSSPYENRWSTSSGDDSV